MTVGSDVPDCSRPSVDVERRTDADWQWGVTHTVRPERLAPMHPGLEYSITVKVQRAVPALDRDPPLAGLYARALTIAGARCHAFTREAEDVHQRILCHAWRAVPSGSNSVVFAMVMMGLMRAPAGLVPPPGEPAPTMQELTTGGGATMEELKRRSPQRATEVFVEFDHRHHAASGELFTYSYGERVVHPVESFEPFVRRAENNARAHQALVDALGTSPIPACIALHEWYLADNLVSVDLHLKP